MKDFLKVLGAFKRLDEGLKRLSLDGFESTLIKKLILSAPNLSEPLLLIQKHFQMPAEGRHTVPLNRTKSNPTGAKTYDLYPEDGMDEEYDQVQAEIMRLEDLLEEELKELENDVGSDI